MTRVLTVAGIFVLSAFTSAGADTLRDQCLGTASQRVPVVATDLGATKLHLSQGHYRLVLLEAPKIEVVAKHCIAGGYDVESFQLLHSYALLMEAQARLATGDAQGAVLMRNGVDEATALSNSPSASRDIRSMARDAAYGGNLELKALKTAKPGQLMTPPPPAPK